MKTLSILLLLAAPASASDRLVCRISYGCGTAFFCATTPAVVTLSISAEDNTLTFDDFTGNTGSFDDDHQLVFQEGPKMMMREVAHTNSSRSFTGQEESGKVYLLSLRDNGDVAVSFHNSESGQASTASGNCERVSG